MVTTKREIWAACEAGLMLTAPLSKEKELQWIGNDEQWSIFHYLMGNEILEKDFFDEARYDALRDTYSKNDPWLLQNRN